MNTQVITNLRMIDKEGEDQSVGTKISGIQVLQSKETPAGLVQIDVRDFKGKSNLLIEIELPELVSALSYATINRENT